MGKLARWFAIGVLVTLTSACSSLEGAQSEMVKKSNAEVPRYAATIRLLPYVDERNMGNARKIGAGAENLSGLSGLHGTDILLDKDVAALVGEEMSKRLTAAGYQMVDKGAMFEMGGVVKELTYNVRAKDEVAITVQSELKDAATGKVLWSGIVVEKPKDRFAGVMGNSMDDVLDYLRKELGVVTRKTSDAIGAVLMAQRPELFNIIPGTKAIPGVTVLNAPGAASAVPAAMSVAAGINKGVLVIGTAPGQAKVSIDEVYYGTTPLHLDMEPGIHKITVELDGYKKVSQKVSVRAGETTDLELKLKNH